MKKKTIGMAFIGVTLIYIATAFIIPFPHELNTYILARLMGELSVNNIINAVAIEWVVGVIVLGAGILIYYLSGHKLTFRRKQ